MPQCWDQGERNWPDGAVFEPDLSGKSRVVVSVLSVDSCCGSGLIATWLTSQLRFAHSQDWTEICPPTGAVLCWDDLWRKETAILIQTSDDHVCLDYRPSSWFIDQASCQSSGFFCIQHSVDQRGSCLDSLPSDSLQVYLVEVCPNLMFHSSLTIATSRSYSDQRI